MEVLLTMAAQRYGIRPSTYARTRTYLDFWLDVRALTQTWAWPLGVISAAFGRGSKDEDDGSAPAPQNKTEGRPATRLPPWYRVTRGRQYNLHDLGPIEGEEKLPLGRKRTMSTVDMDDSKRALMTAFGGRKA